MTLLLCPHTGPTGPGDSDDPNGLPRVSGGSKTDSLMVRRPGPVSGRAASSLRGPDSRSDHSRPAALDVILACRPPASRPCGLTDRSDPTADRPHSARSYPAARQPASRPADSRNDRRSRTCTPTATRDAIPSASPAIQPPPQMIRSPSPVRRPLSPSPYQPAPRPRPPVQHQHDHRKMIALRSP
jgi:hypothetical protein